MLYKNIQSMCYICFNSAYQTKTDCLARKHKFSPCSKWLIVEVDSFEAINKMHSIVKISSCLPTDKLVNHI